MSSLRQSPYGATLSRGIDAAARIAGVVVDDAIQSIDTTAMATVEWTQGHSVGGTLAGLLGVAVLVGVWLWQRQLTAALPSVSWRALGWRSEEWSSCGRPRAALRERGLAASGGRS